MRQCLNLAITNKKDKKMNRKFVKLLAVTLSLAGAAAFAQADSSELDQSNGSISLGIGVSYRNFKRASLKGPLCLCSCHRAGF